ncbi:hypothetical protein CSIM01_12665 [Colletotrichum simmondsii]|uniref:Uncharacterized protein n=1 Tax=Colletotrichum simmondsii TaxID=703756 RepID=A0A135TFD8_9PEZI|nr:hypothetical protein CSIM01_12665 [Colletotrichum simmondsii]
MNIRAREQRPKRGVASISDRNPQGYEHKPGAKLSAWGGIVALACSQEIDTRPSGEGFQNSSRRRRRRVSRRGITAASKGWAAPPSRRFICDEGGVFDVNLSLEGLFLLSTPSGILREGWTTTGSPRVIGRRAQDYTDFLLHKARPQSQAPCVVSALNRGALARADWGPVSHWPIGFTVMGSMAKGRVSRTGLEASNTPLTARRGLWTEARSMTSVKHQAPEHSRKDTRRADRTLSTTVKVMSRGSVPESSD